VLFSAFFDQRATNDNLWWDQEAPKAFLLHELRIVRGYRRWNGNRLSSVPSLASAAADPARLFLEYCYQTVQKRPVALDCTALGTCTGRLVPVYAPFHILRFGQCSLVFLEFRDPRGKKANDAMIPASCSPGNLSNGRSQ